MLLKKSQELLPTAKCGASPTSSSALCHPSLSRAFLSRHPPHTSGTDKDLLHPRHKFKAKDEATTDLLCSQTWFLHRCCRSAFGWSFLRTFSAAKVSPTFLVLHLLCAPILPSQVPNVCPSHCFSMSTTDCFGSEPWLLLCPEAVLLGNRTQKYEFSKEQKQTVIAKCNSH